MFPERACCSWGDSPARNTIKTQKNPHMHPSQEIQFLLLAKKNGLRNQKMLLCCLATDCLATVSMGKQRICE